MAIVLPSPRDRSRRKARATRPGRRMRGTRRWEGSYSDEYVPLIIFPLSPPGLGKGRWSDSGRQDQRDQSAGEETGLHSNAIVHRVDVEA